MPEEIYDIVIIGGGIIGSATAYYLMKADTSIKVAVIERDPSYARASTTLSMGNARIQFSLKQNIQISQYTFEVLERFEEEMAVGDCKPNIGHRRDGNLFLVDAEDQHIAEAAYEVQRELGCRIEWWTPEKIRRHFPLYETGGLIGGTFGPDDGHFDGYAMLMAYKAKARELGADFLTDETTAVCRSGHRIGGVSLASGQFLAAGSVINCAGAWAARIAATVGVNLPVVPIKRQVFALDTAVKPERPLPLTVLPSGLYFRSDTGGIILLGKSMSEDEQGYGLSWDEKRFMEELWPELAEFVPAFDRLRLVSGWAGLYAVNTLDGNAILGEWPEVQGLYLANGFSGHGLQQAPAVARYLTELILSRPLSLDLAVFSPARIIAQEPLSEGGLV